MEIHETEFLLPQIRKHVVLEELPFVRANHANPSWTEERLRATINELGHWEYHFAFSHGLTTEINSTFDRGTIDFQRFRTKLISETVADLLEGELGRSTVL